MSEAVDVVGDFSQRCERGRGVALERDEGGGERGRRVAILFSHLEPQHQRHELGLDAVV